MVRIGIVGAGLRGRMFASALAGQPGVDVVGFAEPSERVAQAARESTGLPVVASHTALLSDFDPDAVIVATPDFAHRTVAVDVARAGKALLIEKPLATTLEDARAIRDAVRESGVRALVGFENRWNAHVVRTLDAIRSGSIGRPVTASALLSNTYFVPTEMLSWAAKSSPGWFLLPHTVDLVMALLDQTPTEVFAVGSRGVLAERGVDTWDVIHVLLRLDGGATVTLTSTWILPDAADGIADFRYSVIGTDGAVNADLSHQGLVVVSDKLRSEWPVGGRIGTGDVGAAPWMAQHFARALIDGSDLGPDVDHGLVVTEVICAVEESLRTGSPVTLEALRR